MSAAPRCPDWEGFVREMFDDAHDRGDWDGGTIQDVAEKHGVLIRTKVTEPCDPDHCVCAEYEMPTECFRLAPPAPVPAAPTREIIYAHSAKAKALGIPGPWCQKCDALCGAECPNGCDAAPAVPPDAGRREEVRKCLARVAAYTKCDPGCDSTLDTENPCNCGRAFALDDLNRALTAHPERPDGN